MFLVSYPKNYLEDHQRAYPLYFPLGILQLQVFCLGFNPFWVEFVWYEDLTHFYMCLSDFPNIIHWRDYSFSIVNSWHPGQRLLDYVHVCLFLGSPFCFTGERVYLHASIILFWLIHFSKYILKYVSVISPVFFFLLKIMLGVCSLVVSYNF